MTGPDTIAPHFRRQAAYCTTLGSPLTAAILTVIADRLGRAQSDAADAPDWTAALRDWPGDPGADALALRVAGALHRAVLDGDAELAVAYAARRVDAATIDAAFTRHPGLLARYLQGPPQTNDPLRSAVLLGGFLTIAAETGRPLALREIGASAGLNLMWDTYAYDFGSWCFGDPMAAPLLLQAQWQGPRPPATKIAVHSRAGCDVQPLDARDPEQRKRLLSYIWADQGPRLERIAMALDHAGRGGPPPERIPAGDFVTRELAARPRDAALVFYHSIVWQYVDPGEQRHIAEAMAAAGQTATAEAPLAWLRFEPGTAKDGADLSLTLWPGGTTRRLAEADYHGRWVRWTG